MAIIDSENSVHGDVRWARDVANNSLARRATSVTVGNQETDLYPHGTHVAGIISAVRNNAQGVAGVCDQCEVLPIVFNPGSGDQGLAAAIRLAVRMDAQVINMSLELRDETHPLSASCSTAFPHTRAAVAEAAAMGVTLVASVGNHGTTFDGGASPNERNAQNVSPASCAGVISVGATDQLGRMSSYTNVGAMLMAPGGGAHANNNGHAGAFGAGVGCTLRDGGGGGDVPSTSTAGVLSAWRDGANVTTCYRHLSGTSMAAPHVAGVVGLMLAANPRLTPAQIQGILQAPTNATPVPGCTSVHCGAGMLNAERAVNAAFATAGAAVAYKGICRFALGETCTIDTFDESPNGRLSVTAYGKIWNFDANGA
ncbi:MAG: S8 family peptidase, partial [Phycisphaerales bacterium]